MAQTIDKLTLKEMMFHYELYEGLPQGLMQLPVPRSIVINKKNYPIPEGINEFTNNLCYGQRVFFSVDEEDDFGLMIRLMDGYYYPIVEKAKWDGDKALIFGKKIITCTVNELYPVATHLAKLVKAMADRETELLHREPSKVELAAGIEKLTVFSELNAIDFLRDAMKITVPEVLLTPYNECLVRFMIAKETMEYNERYQKLYMESLNVKSKSRFANDNA